MPTQRPRATDDRYASDWAARLAQSLTDAGVSSVAFVPDSAIGQVISHLPASAQRILVGREEEGVGVAAGLYLGGQLGAVLMQNTGMGNAVNAIASYAVPAGIPMLLIVNHRGDIGEFNPAQVPLGMATHTILDSLGVAYRDLDDVRTLATTVQGCAMLALTMRRPVALILRTSLTGGKEG